MQTAITKNKLRNFGYLIGVGIPLIIGWIIPATGGHDFRLWTLMIGIPCIFLSAIDPMLLLYPYKIWMSIGNTMGWINSRIILTIIFVVVLIPIACMMNLLGYDALERKRKKGSSYRRFRKNSQIDLTRIF